MNEYAAPIVTVLMGVIGVAILATLVSRNSNTSGVIKETATGFSTVLNTAISPIMGNNNYTLHNRGY